jgi:phage head maturation protease
MTYVIQGIACEFGKCFSDGREIIYLKSGCFDSCSEADIRLLLDHKGKSLGTTADRLEIHIGKEAMAFRYTIPDSSWNTTFSEPADDLNTYVPVSIGCNPTKTETITIDGVQVKVIVEATLNEISLLSQEPANKSTYGRVVSSETTGSLDDDYDAGRLELVGRYVNLHRAHKASENNGIVQYTHASSPYERAAANFERKLQTLMK